MSISENDFLELVQRVSTLEEENSHMQKDFDELNKVLTQVNLEHDIFRKTIAELTSKMSIMSETTQSNNQDNPHLGANR